MLTTLYLFLLIKKITAAVMYFHKPVNINNCHTNSNAADHKDNSLSWTGIFCANTGAPCRLSGQ